MSTATTTTTASGTTVTMIGGNHRKFYRVLVVDDVEVRQWGRIGTNGQFKRIDHSGVRAAEASAEKQVQAKMAKGYGARTDLTFAIDEKLIGRSDLPRMLAATYEAAEAGVNRTRYADVDDELDNLLRMGDHEDTPEHRASSESMQQVADRALGVVTLAATGVEEASVQYAELRDDFAAVTEQYERAQGLLETIEAML